ncbi:MAG TPA: class I SAM-dependent methyltransferase [Salinivirgaceae bacterium]|nr:class I SAM-dependent methyltransferase [Salinivirgaceae bacterium]HQA75503.1 class I SAM-dependent methyltransferase [Salinivirgaceae bacterium]
MKCIVDSRHEKVVFLFTKNNYNIYLCEKCKTIMAEVSFVHEQYESKDYYTVKYTEVKQIEKFWGFRFDYILRKLSKYKIQSILDVGAGNGFFVWKSRETLKIKSEGVEIAKNERDFAKKTFNIELNSDLNSCNTNYDALTLFNVIEHVEDPYLLLNNLKNKIKPQGIIAITTPNPKGFQRIFFGLKNWVMIMPPHHINIFSKQSLIEILENVNFEILHYETLNTYFCADFFTKYGTRFQIVRRIIMFIFRILNIGADHFVIAKKL